MDSRRFMNHDWWKTLGSPAAPMTGGTMVALPLLILAGVLGNYLTIPLFFGADFIFGSVAVLLVLYLYGLPWGMAAAILIHSYTYFLWEHPYGWINFVSEALFIGFFLRKGGLNILQLDGYSGC